ncbi:hypothetical protein NADFUDRAFT_83852 [Nadsonia fulvescens var. elongata DSM 6958]|uniref:Arrestin-like N-terminal domain-containing protein n=1 Tax=Nadsonia fulvescens var. elongata DSM 6958 TaxID=857566 RepID=A0A1E3PG02_9ASCO|nr:hypothetical protein NADFUDRAFT_83852 [Nadsonia fulvescens var. elongata DSM 6958]
MFERTAISALEIKQTPTIAIVLEQQTAGTSGIKSPVYDIGDKVSGYIKITPRKAIGRTSPTNGLLFSKVNIFLEGIEQTTIQHRYSEKSSRRRFLKMKQFIPESEYPDYKTTCDEPLRSFEYGFQYKIPFEFEFPTYLDENLVCSSKFHLHSRLPPSIGGDEQWGKIGVDMTGAFAKVQYMIAAEIEMTNQPDSKEAAKIIARNWRPLCFVPSYPAPLVPINRQMLTTTNKSNRHFDFNVSFNPVTSEPYFWTEAVLKKKLGGVFEVKSLGNIQLQIQSLPEIIYGGSSTLLPVELVFTPRVSESAGKLPTNYQPKLPQITYIDASLQIVTVASITHQIPLQYASQDQLANYCCSPDQASKGKTSANNGKLTIDTVRLTSSVPGEIEWQLSKHSEPDFSELPPDIDAESAVTSQLAHKNNQLPNYELLTPISTPTDESYFSLKTNPTSLSSGSASVFSPRTTQSTSKSSATPSILLNSTKTSSVSYTSKFSFPLTFPQILPPSYFSCLTSRNYIILLTVRFSTGSELVLKLPLNVISSKQGKFELALKEAAFFNGENFDRNNQLSSLESLVSILNPKDKSSKTTTSTNSATGTAQSAETLPSITLQTVKSPEYSERPADGELDISKLVLTQQQELAMGVRAPGISSLSSSSLSSTFGTPSPSTSPGARRGSGIGEPSAKGLYLYTPSSDS